MLEPGPLSAQSMALKRHWVRRRFSAQTGIHRVNFEVTPLKLFPYLAFRNRRG